MHRRHHLHGADHKTIGFWSIYPLSLLFIFHTLLTAYINSVYMEQYLSPEGVGALYTIGSAIAVIAFLFFSHALRAIGNVKLTFILAALDILSLLALGAAETRAVAITAFVAFMVVNPLLYLNIDIFSEALIGKDESGTGSKRGFTLMLMSLAAAIAPLSMSYIIDTFGDLSSVYYAAAGIFSFFIVFLFWQFRTFEDPSYEKFHVRKSLREMWLYNDLRNVMFSHFLLQFFFAWAVIYMPIYMVSEVGFDWDQIGYITAFGLFAYVIFEWPIGYIGDRWIGEKEVMALGFVVLAITSSWLAFMSEPIVIPWMILIFMSRVGAAMVEATTESYFFKHTKGDDADTISVFRLLRPLSNVFGALLGGAALLFLPFNLIFIVLGFVMVFGIFSTVALHDTK